MIDAVVWGQVPAELPFPANGIPSDVKAFLSRHCTECHGGAEPKGDLRLDQLAVSLHSASERAAWRSVYQRLAAGEMPPPSQPQPTAAELTAVTDWIRRAVDAAEAAHREREGRVALRRLNRVQYENTIRDLLGIEIALKDLLPLDTSQDGFDNASAALHVSSFLIEKYLDAADAALNVAIVNGPQPPLVNRRLLVQDQRHVKVTTEKVFLERDGGLVMFASSPWQAVVLNQFYPPDRGRYRFRISASAYQSGGQPVTVQIDAGPMLLGSKNHLVGYFDVLAGKPKVIEFIDHLEARNTVRILPYGLASAQAVNKVGADRYDGPGLLVHWIDVEGPLYDTWPPECHRRIFGDLPQANVPIPDQRNRLEVVSSEPHADAKRILRNFARRAFRRHVADADVQPFVDLFEAKLAEGYSFEQAVRVALKAILVSPDFLFLREAPGRLDDFALASRLSYFLWSSLPDDELLNLAANQSLSDPAVLPAQVERLLNDPRARAFTENFVGQWLGLRDIDFTEPDRRLYPEFDDLLKTSMVQETCLFFEHVLQHDLSVANFVHSEFTFLNDRLAKHYGIDGVDGHEFQKVTLPPGSHRGGVMTMASVLKVTANGTTTSPVVRGAWVLRQLLGTPPKPPPAGVPAVEPDIRGATTIREQLARHREVESCAACHQHIDPPGFALESFDVIGGFREHYRTLGSGGTVVVDGRRMAYHRGKPVDPADTLADGRSFHDSDELKQLLLADRDQLARNLAVKLLAYGTGAAPGAADDAAVEQIVVRVRERGYGFRSLIHAVAACNLMCTK